MDSVSDFRVGSVIVVDELDEVEIEAVVVADESVRDSTPLVGEKFTVRETLGERAGVGVTDDVLTLLGPAHPLLLLAMEGPLLLLEANEPLLLRKVGHPLLLLDCATLPVPVDVRKALPVLGGNVGAASRPVLIGVEG